MAPPYQWTSCKQPSRSSGGTRPRSTCIRSGQASFDFVDGTIEGFNRHPAQLIRKDPLQRRVKMVPEGKVATDHVFPQPGLAFMHACGSAGSERGAFEYGADTLFVQRVAGLMQYREQ